MVQWAKALKVRLLNNAIPLTLVKVKEENQLYNTVLWLSHVCHGTYVCVSLYTYHIYSYLHVYLHLSIFLDISLQISQEMEEVISVVF